jgi:hypothetical protein
VFLRWKRRRWADDWRRDEDRFTKSAVVVRSVRTEAGPRLKHICFLASVIEGREGWDSEQKWFWKAAEQNLDKAGITGADRERITTTLEKTIPRPKPDLEVKPRRRRKDS